jgi:peptidoglycan/xylan/chitin deacetylase (PgdA/CDA1 family)
VAVLSGGGTRALRGLGRRAGLLGGVLLLALLASALAGASSTDRSRVPPRRTALPGGLPPRPHVRPPRRYRGRVPILMYHLVRNAPPGSPNPGLYVRRRSFFAQMRWLRRHRYRAVTLARVVAAWHGRARLPRRPVVLTFDDGYAGDYTTVMPLLRRWGWPGVLDLTLSSFRSRGGLTHRRVRRLLRAGWELAAHTISHVDLTTVHGRRLRREVAGCRRVLQLEFGAPVTDFAYPSGRFDRQVVRAVRAAGYRAAVTTAPGLAGRRHPLALRRLRVEQVDGLAGFADLLRSG